MEKTMSRTQTAVHEQSSQVGVRRAGVFYLIAYAISWLSWMLLIAFPQLDGQPRVLWTVGKFGPFLAAIAAMYAAWWLLLSQGGRIRYLLIGLGPRQFSVQSFTNTAL